MTTQPTRLEVRANMQLTDEQIHAISHAQKVLRAVKLYDRAELLSASKPAAQDGIPDELKQRGLDDHLRRLAEQEQGMKSEEDVKPSGWKGSPDASPAAPAHCQCAACKTGTIHASDCAVHNAPALPVGECDCGAAAPAQSAEPVAQSSPTAVVLDERADVWRDAFNERHEFDVYPEHFMSGLRNEFAAGWHAALKSKARATSPQPVEQTRALTDEQIREIALKYCAHEMPARFYNILRYECEEDFFNLVRELTAARPASGDK